MPPWLSIILPKLLPLSLQRRRILDSPLSLNLALLALTWWNSPNRLLTFRTWIASILHSVQTRRLLISYGIIWCNRPGRNLQYRIWITWKSCVLHLIPIYNKMWNIVFILAVFFSITSFYRLFSTVRNEVIQVLPVRAGLLKITSSVATMTARSTRST